MCKIQQFIYVQHMEQLPTSSIPRLDHRMPGLCDVYSIHNHGHALTNAEVCDECSQGRLSLGASLTGERLPCKQGLPPLVIGIDPDGSGALAAIQVQSLPQPDTHEIQDVEVQLHDNPVEIFQSTTRKRRQV